MIFGLAAEHDEDRCIRNRRIDVIGFLIKHIKKVWFKI